MNQRERFHALMRGEPVDRLPLLFFGTWPETKARWHEEGLDVPLRDGSDTGPCVPGMDTDWEGSPAGTGDLWNNQGLLLPGALSSEPAQVIAEDGATITTRSPFGGIRVSNKLGSSIPQTLRHDLTPDRSSWERFRRHLDPTDPSRWQPGWQMAAERLNARDHMTCFFGGTLYGWARDWLGVEAISCLAYEDPVLFEDIIAFLADYFIALNTPLLQRVSFDFAYVFEDCCFKNGPLISPALYERFYDRHYRRMIAAYHDLGVPLVLIDSDGKVDDLLPLWLKSGFDIVFPIEVGTWRADPVALRKKHGKRLRMMGGVDKHVIARGEDSIRRELLPLRSVVAEGGYLPMPDHRIAPDVSLAQFRTYLCVFRDVFGGVWE
jgi:hypothetical protein